MAKIAVILDPENACITWGGAEEAVLRKCSADGQPAMMPDEDVGIAELLCTVDRALDQLNEMLQRAEMDHTPEAVALLNQMLLRIC